MSKKVVVSTVLLALSVGVGVAVSASPPLTDKEQLGKDIFFDMSLSLNGNQSCATCHGPGAGWTGPDADINAHGAVYEGSISDAFGDRKPPSSAYATQSPVLHVDKKGVFVGGNFWDGRATGETLGSPAAEQAKGPFLNPVEQALPDAATLVGLVCASTYATLFKAVWGEAMCDPVNADTAYDNIGYSIAAYEASSEVNAFTAKYDWSMQGKAKLTQLERRGFALFQGKGKCSKCHVSEGRAPLFTDYTYDNLGIPKNPENPATIANSSWADPGLGGFLATRTDYATYAEANMGKHKVPTLRNVDLRPSDETVKGKRQISRICFFPP